jgi:hypothetical protein
MDRWMNGQVGKDGQMDVWAEVWRDGGMDESQAQNVNLGLPEYKDQGPDSAFTSFPRPTLTPHVCMPTSRCVSFPRNYLNSETNYPM